MKAIQKILLAATSEFAACPTWRPVLIDAWEEFGRVRKMYEGWGKDAVQLSLRNRAQTKSKDDSRNSSAK